MEYIDLLKEALDGNTSEKFWLSFAKWKKK